MGWVGAAVEVASTIFGAIQQNNQNKANEAFVNTALNNQGGALTEAGSLAKQEAQGLPYQQLLDVQKGGIQSLKSQVGGLPNEGMLVKQLFGGTVENALESSINTRNSALNSAIGAELGIGSQYGRLGEIGLGATQNQTNPWSGVFSSVGGLFNKGGTSASGAGSTGLDTSMIPSAGSGYLSLPPDLSTDLPLPLPSAVS